MVIIRNIVKIKKYISIHIAMLNIDICIPPHTMLLLNKKANINY